MQKQMGQRNIIVRIMVVVAFVCMGNRNNNARIMAVLEICVHGKQKYHCLERGGGGGICKYDRHKRCCKDCGGSGLCKVPL